MLNIRGDKVSHTSDYFDEYEYALKMIREGKAYVDDTERDCKLPLCILSAEFS